MDRKPQRGPHSPAPAKPDSEPEKAKSGIIPPAQGVKDKTGEDAPQPVPPKEIEKNLR